MRRTWPAWLCVAMALRHPPPRTPPRSRARRAAADDADLEFRALASEVARGRRAWPDGGGALNPRPEYSPRDVCRLTLGALARPHVPRAYAGAATLARFSADGFAPAWPWSARALPPPPPVLSALFDDPRSQYNLLVHPRRFEVVFASDEPFCADGESAFEEIHLQAAPLGGGGAAALVPGRGEHGCLVKLGWELTKREADGCWVTSAWHWHDFRDEFRPGLGQEEWPRICG